MYIKISQALICRPHKNKKSASDIFEKIAKDLKDWIEQKKTTKTISMSTDAFPVVTSNCGIIHWAESELKK